jgi:hypothetical protein
LISGVERRLLAGPAEEESELPLNDDFVVRRSIVSSDAAIRDLAEVPAPGSPAVERFHACRWRRPGENGTPECCSHRDVLPLTGANGFDAAAWCPDCDFYKLRRTPKKRDDYGMGF